MAAEGTEPPGDLLEALANLLIVMERRKEPAVDRMEMSK